MVPERGTLSSGDRESKETVSLFQQHRLPHVMAHSTYHHTRPQAHSVGD